MTVGRRRQLNLPKTLVRSMVARRLSPGWFVTKWSVIVGKGRSRHDRHNQHQSPQSTRATPSAICDEPHWPQTNREMMKPDSKNTSGFAVILLAEVLHMLNQRYCSSRRACAKPWWHAADADRSYVILESRILVATIRHLRASVAQRRRNQVNPCSTSFATGKFSALRHMPMRRSDSLRRPKSGIFSLYPRAAIGFGPPTG